MQSIIAFLTQLCDIVPYLPGNKTNFQHLCALMATKLDQVEIVATIFRKMNSLEILQIRYVGF